MSELEKTLAETPTRALRMRDFCRAYGISRASAYKMMGKGQLRTVLVAGRRLVPVDVAESLLRSDVA